MDDNVVERLSEIGKKVKFPKPIVALPRLHRPNDSVTATASSTSEGFSTRASIDSNLFTSWKASKDDKSPVVEYDFGKPESFNFVSIHGGYQKTVKKYSIETLVDGKWQILYKGGEMTFHEKDYFDLITAQKYRIKMLECKGVPELVEVAFVRY